MRPTSCLHTTLLLVLCIHWLGTGSLALTKQEAEQIKTKLDMVKSRVDAINTRVRRTTDTVNNAARRGLPEVPDVPEASPTSRPTQAPNVNIALGKRAFQSSTAWEKHAGLAVDGDTNGDYYADSCQHNWGEANPWWAVDLGQPYRIHRVVIFNRLDYEPGRLNPFNIHIGDSEQVTANPKCGDDHRIDVTRPTVSVSCQGMRGRYVGIRLPGSYRSMTLCEVRVFSGSGPTLIASAVPPGYSQRGDTSYKLFGTLQDHASAQRTCEADGGRLANVKTEALNNFLRGLIPDWDHIDYWIGLDDTDGDGFYEWSDGTRLDGCVFTRWTPDEPNNVGVQNCIHMYAAFDFKWDDDFCHFQKYFICQIGPGEGNTLRPGQESDCDQSGGQRCAFPFTYQGVTYHSCTTAAADFYWCSLDHVYSGSWKRC